MIFKGTGSNISYSNLPRNFEQQTIKAYFNKQLMLFINDETVMLIHDLTFMIQIFADTEVP